jgi:hypothetical protein
VGAKCRTADREKRLDDVTVFKGRSDAESLQCAERLEASKHTGVALIEGHHRLS